MYGFYRIATSVPKVQIANPSKNVENIIEILEEENKNESSIVLFPELCITGYTAGDLFLNQNLLDSQNKALKKLLQKSEKYSLIAIVGIVVSFEHRLFNCAAVIQRGKILGIVPKSYLPNKNEFYEKRYFQSGIRIKSKTLKLLNQEIPFGVDLLFSDENDITFGIEICEDLWSILPPSNQMAINGANMIFNLSASNELVGKSSYRQELVKTQSARLVCAYIYSSCGVGESSSDTIFGGDALICEYGSILAKTERFSLDNQTIRADIDLEKVIWLRNHESYFGDSIPTEVRVIKIASAIKISKLNRYINKHPFVPYDEKVKKEVCEEITNIQAHGLIKRLTHINSKKVVIGISGGLDSTLALLATYKAYEILNYDFKGIIAITMPGFGTTSRTKSNAIKLCETLGVTIKEIPISDISLKEFEALGHDKNIHDVTYENVQARARTSILMNLANKEGAIVIGTGDLSEIALGWCTYNGDHMSMYSLNSGIPKTLISYLVEYFTYKNEIKEILIDILNTPISPELLPHDSDKISQETESIIGPYELHDFFLYHFLRYGAKPSKILFLADEAFKEYSKNEIKKWLDIFIKRFFTQQFKRNAMPDGVKVGTISLSPRADWRMPSDASFEEWLELP
ncbi:NAD(+) synthase [Halarcobacter anaerophilus]|uniref:Glutamine-dependent NAD(+) synthetase n=1 Tax=Halarcobacter anaerophilus TaxID=877500 RepID=A0A4Q0Y3K0_9BACT|nr:NAD(+) synthase [Halarcobacter anaerophilus]QDF29490.1 NAD synthetase, glutamine-dependent [Halarcobacter anaerophilus]RXJ64730.1 NAD(+) synthase [Halarcobacter anaerophilus]